MNARRKFIKSALATGAGIAVAPTMGFTILKPKPKLSEQILGHGNYRYKVHKEWGNLDRSKTPVINCHEMVMDSKGRLIMVTDDTHNNIIIYDKSGKLIKSWGDSFPGGHGLSLAKEGGEDYLFICDPSLGAVVKTTVDGKTVLTLDDPKKLGIYKEDMAYRPTETTIAPNGDIYVADGYGSQFIIQYDAKGKYIRHFGGKGNNDDQFETVHGVAVDLRDKNNPTLLCTSRVHNAFKRFSMDGKYQSTIFLPGAFVCRPVPDGENIYAGVCWSRLKYLNQTDNSGFVTILDKNNKVISNPGGTKPKFVNGDLQLMVQEVPVFKHCHDVCVDEDKNLYVCQWNADKAYPSKLERV
ncbi:peptidylglycine monooxygenase-like protein [soil metagenome]